MRALITKFKIPQNYLSLSFKETYYKITRISKHRLSQYEISKKGNNFNKNISLYKKKTEDTLNHINPITKIRKNW